MDPLNFAEDIRRGKIGEDIFKEDFLDFLNINYLDVTSKQQFQAIDTDFNTKIGLYEIKTNYKDDNHIIIEEYTNCNLKYGSLTWGWWYKTKADLIVFISKATRDMILLPLDDNLRDYYDFIKEDYNLIRNKPTQHNGKMWQSAFRRINLDDLIGFYSRYKKV